MPVLTPFDEETSIQSQRSRLVEALKRVADHDVAAMRQLYELMSAKLFGICVRICGDSSSAEDVMQDVLTKIWANASTFDPARSSPVTWLCTIARNTAIDWHRANDRRMTRGALPAETLMDSRSGAEQELIDQQESERLHLCIEQLESRQRYCIRAAFFDGFTYIDLAEQVDAPLNTVKTWMRRAMHHLKKCLADG